MTNYQLHYASCQQKYGKFAASVYELILNKDWVPESKTLSKMAKKIAERFDSEEGCFYDDYALRLNDWHNIPEIAEYAEEVMPFIEENIFSSNLKVQFVHPYRSIYNAKEDSSWIWHYDDNPRPFIKLFVYLNETTKDNGCLEYVVDENDKPVILPTYRDAPHYMSRPQHFPKSRVPQSYVDEILQKGGKIKQLEGSAGTTFVWTPNIIHRATAAKEGTTPRDAIIYYLRPCLNKQDQFVDENTHSYIPKHNVKVYELD